MLVHKSVAVALPGTPGRPTKSKVVESSKVVVTCGFLIESSIGTLSRGFAEFGFKNIEFLLRF